jgi:hypothetical protein
VLRFFLFDCTWYFVNKCLVKYYLVVPIGKYPSENSGLQKEGVKTDVPCALMFMYICMYACTCVCTYVSICYVCMYVFFNYYY